MSEEVKTSAEVIVDSGILPAEWILMYRVLIFENRFCISDCLEFVGGPKQNKTMRKAEMSVKLTRTAHQIIQDRIEKDKWLEEFFPKQMEIYHNARTKEQLLKQQNY